jgi:hypothetical protein
MNDKEILQFLKAFEDFAKHSEEQIDSYQKWEEAKNYTELFYEQKLTEKFWEEVNYLAKKYEVTCDYILQEFYINNK